MKLIFSLYGVFMLSLIGNGIILFKNNSPEELLVGKWEEVAWEYEKVNHSDDQGMRIDDVQKIEICRNLIIHKAEVWNFDKNRKLELYENNHLKEVLKWNLKGRGHILELRHDDKRLEDYQLQEITNDNLVIHFNFDLQVRGIVKMTFKRIDRKQYAEEI